MLESLESRCLLASLGGEVFVDADGNGQKGPTEVGAAAVRVYLDGNENQTLDAGELSVETDALGQYLFAGVPAGSHVIRVLPPPGQVQTSPTAYYGTGYTTVGDGSGTNPTQLYEMSLSGTVRPIGAPTTDRIHDLVRTNDGSFYGVNFQTDGIYSIDPLTGQETLLSQASVDLVAGLAYDPGTDTIYTVVDENGAIELRTIDKISGQVLPSTAASVSEVRAINFGSTFYDFDPATQTSVAVPRQPFSPFASTLDVRRSDGAIFGLQGNSLNRYAFPTAGSIAVTVSTLTQPIEAISFDANDQLFGVDAGNSTFHSIDLASGVVGVGVPITFNGNSISGITGFDIAPDGTHYLVDSTYLYSFDPMTGVATQASNRALPPSSPIFTSLSAAADGTLYATLFNTTTPVAQIDPATGLATRLGSNPLGSPYASLVAQASLTRLSGLTAVSDLAFDTVRQRIVGFDNDSDQFFEFTTDGVGSILATANRPLNSWSLAFNGSTFVMFDQDDPNFTQALEVDPDTGEIMDAFTASQRIPTEGLFHAKLGDVAYRLTLNGSETITGLSFGLAVPENITPRPADFPTVINEILVDLSLAGSEDTDQYLEFRGEPGGQLNPNTYFVIVDEEDSNRGEIHGIFDLSDQALGANGFLVLLEQNSLHQVDPASAVLRSTLPGFGGLPGGIYTDSNATSDHIDSIVGANSYFLIETDVPPLLGDDIDFDNDGLADPDGVKANWTVLDSVSLHPAVFSGSQAYGQILLAETDLGQDPTRRTVEPGTPIVVGEGFGYAGRIGDSVGSSPDDWVFGSVSAAERNVAGRTTLFELNGGLFSYPIPRAFQFRDLDHLGGSNFVGGVRGTIQIAPALDATDPNGYPPPIAPAVGLTVLADANNNGVQDVLMHIVEPDNAVDRNNAVDANGNEIHFPLSNAFPGVTITVVDSNNDPTSSPEVQTSRQQINFTPTQNYIFSSGFSDNFYSFRRLRFDFYRPVSEASIDAIGYGFSLIPTYGRLEAYDANDQLIDTDVSGLLVGQRRETITVKSANEDIAYVVAYGDDTIANSFFARFDRLTFKQSEASAVTDDNGQFEIKNLFPGIYNVSVLQNEQSQDLIGGVPKQISISRYENFLFNETLRPNTPPQVEPEIQFTVDENVPAGTTIGYVSAADLDRQTLQFEMLDDDGSGLLIDPVTGELTVGPDAQLDFEQTPVIVLIVGISDSLTTAITQVTVSLNDLNEAPVVEETDFFVAEDTANGTTIGQVEAFDPDFQQKQVLTFSITGGSGLGIFAINPANGLITLVDETKINFETLSELHLDIRVSDNAVPPLHTDIDQRIQVIDQNDPPVISTTQFLIPENSTGVVGLLKASDPDIGQTHVFELLGGSGASVFQVSRSGEIAVRTGAKLDFEQVQSYTLQVITIDSGAPPLAAEATVTLTIGDVNEPPALSQSSVSLAENSLGGTPVTTLMVVDPENSGSAYTIALLNEADASNFAFDPASNQLTVAQGANLDFETKPVNTLNFEITDPTGADAKTRVTLLVQLTDQNDPPIVVTTQVVLSELAAPGTVVGKVEVQIREPDRGDQVTVQIVGGNAANLFRLDPNTRILRVAAGAKFDADGNPPPLAIDVRVTDAGGLSSVGTIDVILNNVNEPPVFVGGAPAPPPVDSGEEFVLVVPPDSIVDPEGGPFSLAIFDANGSLPSWLKFNQATRTLSGVPTPDQVGSYPLTLRAFEPGPPSLFSQVPFTIVVDRGNTPLTNQRNPLDVDANREVAPIDALRVINYITRYGSGVSVNEPHPFTGFVDVSGNGFVTARDALLVINGLRQAQFNQAFGELILADDFDESDAAVDQALVDLLRESALF